jgi:hypothetical protein
LFYAMTSSEGSVGPYDAPPWQPLTAPFQQVANSSSPTRISGFLGNLAVGRNFAGLKPFQDTFDTLLEVTLGAHSRFLPNNEERFE